MNDILVYATKITNRLRYILDHLLVELLGLRLTLTTDKALFVKHRGPKINYSKRQLSKEIFFRSTPLLFERGIKPQNIKVSDYQGTKIFFQCSKNPNLPFDLFAASFYLITRYEEYLATERDQHNRYPARLSLAYRHDFLQQPVIDIWVCALESCLKKRYPKLKFSKSSYHYIPTYDIDIAWAYANKGFLRNIGGALNSLRSWKLGRLKQRLKVLADMEQDPFDTYEWQIELQNKYQLHPIYFFLVGDYGLYDKNISLLNYNYQDLIQSLGDVAEVGIHPSYASNKSVQILQEEIARLSRVIKKEIRKSRQHYLKLKLPETYENLIELDIKHDFSMGYASQIGFRAGTASSFYFYNLNLETKTHLRVFPFAVMDVTLHDYLKLDKEEALIQVKQLIATTKAVDGLFISLWHNHNLCSLHPSWEGWRELYAEIVQEASPHIPQTKVVKLDLSLPIDEEKKDKVNQASKELTTSKETNTMNPTQIDTIVFDLGGVLIDWNPEYLYRKLFKDNREMHFFLNNVCTYDWNMEQDAGRTWAAATALLLPDFPNYQMEIKAYFDRWEEMLGEALDGTVAILKSFIDHPNYRVYALTNWSAETFPIAQALERFAFLHWFDGIVVSGEEKMRKPFPKIYQTLFDRYQIAPEKAVFIDDSLKNVQTSNDLGMHAIHFKSPQQLQKDLEKLLGKE
ncbi:MAG: HAD-IA family hydrolase [Chitinophagales bacterium]